MTFVLALLQSAGATAGTPDKRLYMLLGLFTLMVLVALGLKLFTNMWEVVTAPSASLRHVGRMDNFFFSIALVFLAGLIATFVLLANQPQMENGFHSFAAQWCSQVAQGNGNPTYRDDAANLGTGTLDALVKAYLFNNLVFYPVVAVLFWLVGGFIVFLIARMFGGHTTAGDLLGTLAYPMFFFTIGKACALAGVVPGMDSLATGGTPPMGVLAIVGAVLILYAVVLWLIGIVQAAELTTAQMIGVIVVLGIVLGGCGTAWYQYGAKKSIDNFKVKITSHDPSKPGYKIQ
jgi:hypothetical protein